MAKININKNEKGLTLIELLLYISIFSILFLSISSSVFYLQKIIQSNNENYYIKNQIYRNLNILQNYLYKNSIKLYSENESDFLQIIDKNQSIILTQKLENNYIKNIYKDKEFFINEKLKFNNYKLSFLDNNKLLKFEVFWIDSRGKEQVFTEYLIVINNNL